MAIDWDAELLSPVMRVFGEGAPADASTWPTFVPAGAEPFQLADAVFDAEYKPITVEGDIDITQSIPVLGVRLSLFGSRPPRQGDRVTIPSISTTFTVSDVRPDGHGWAKLILMTAKVQA